MPAPLPPYATPGNVLAGKYALASILGRGGMGVVMEAEHLALGKRVAVKLLLSEADATARARFQLEARAAALIASPHVAQVLDFGFTDDGLAFLVMEHLVGRDLQAEKRARGRLPVAEAVDLMLEAMVGIAEAHAVGLVHRDIKPANIFLATVGGRRIVKILDFGLIKVLDDGAALTNSTETFGTPKYMAPEQLRAARDVDERADQHALAAVLFELVTGTAPFDGETIPDIIVKVCTEQAPLMWSMGVSVPQPLDDAVQRALAKKPAGRFASLAELAFAIAPFGTPRAGELASQIGGVLANRWPNRSVSAQADNPSRERASHPSAALDPTPGRPVSAGTGDRSAIASLADGRVTQPAQAHEGVPYASTSMGLAPTAVLPFATPADPRVSAIGTLSAGSLASARALASEARPSPNRKVALIAALVGGGLAALTLGFAMKGRFGAANGVGSTAISVTAVPKPLEPTDARDGSTSRAAPSSTMPVGPTPTGSAPTASANALASSAVPPKMIFPHGSLPVGKHEGAPSATPPAPPKPCEGLNCL